MNSNVSFINDYFDRASLSGTGEYFSCQMTEDDLSQHGFTFDNVAPFFKCLASVFLNMPEMKYRVVDSAVDEESRTIHLLFERAHPPSPQLPQLPVQRPDHLDRRAEEAYAHAQTARYVWHGSSDYQFSSENLSAKSLISQLALNEQSNKGYLSRLWQMVFPKKVPICDLGAGNGMFPYIVNNSLLGADAIGISAGKKMAELDEAHFIAGDLDDLESLKGRGPFNLVLSSLSIRHLVDPARTISKAYEFVKEGGFLVIDLVPFSGLKGRELRALTHHLIESGYEVVVEYAFDKAGNENRFHFLMIKKNREQLLLPLKYSENPEETYELDSQVAEHHQAPSFENSELLHLKNEGTEELKKVLFYALNQTPGLRMNALMAHLSEMKDAFTTDEVNLLRKAVQTEEIKHSLQKELNRRMLERWGFSPYSFT